MSDRTTFSIQKNKFQTRTFRSNSFGPPPPLGAHRSRRTLSLPDREKPMIPPVIAENPESSQLNGEQHPEEELIQQQQQQHQPSYSDSYEIGWVNPIIGLLASLLLFIWACLLSLSVNNKELGRDWTFYM